MGLNSSRKPKPRAPIENRLSSQPNFLVKSTDALEWHEQTFGGTFDRGDSKKLRPGSKKCETIVSQPDPLKAAPKKCKRKTSQNRVLKVNPFFEGEKAAGTHKLFQIKPIAGNQQNVQVIERSVQKKADDKMATSIINASDSTAASVTVKQKTAPIEKTRVTYGQIAYPTRCRQVILSPKKLRLAGEIYSTQLNTANNSVLKNAQPTVVLSPKSVHWEESAGNVTERNKRVPKVVLVRPLVRQPTFLPKTQEVPNVTKAQPRKQRKIFTDKVRLLLGNGPAGNLDSGDEDIIPLTDRIKSWTKPANIWFMKGEKRENECLC